MLQFYPYLKTILAGCCLAVLSPAYSQSATTVISNNTCAVVDDFNASNGNFTTPSIYLEDFGYQFVYTGPGATANFQSSSAATTAPYLASIISPIYLNDAPDGAASVGFSYSAPAGTAYRIRVLRPNTVTGSVDILALSSEGGPSNWRVLPDASGTICLQLLDGDLHPGQGLRFEFTFYATSTASPVSFDNFSLSNTSAASLPVVFQGILAKREATSVNLKWDVATEIDVKEYRIEKSADGLNFSTAGSVQARHIPIYTFSDEAAGFATLYYRIRSIDLDGKTKLSPIIRLVKSDSYSKTLKVYPTMAQSQITILHDKLSTSAKVTILTMDGKVVKAVVPSATVSNTLVDVGTLHSGMYIIRLDDGSGNVQTTQFIKQ